jgi:cobalt-zinc-cadmium efflux system protein
MAHPHEHNENRPIKNIKLAFFLNLSFTVIEIIGGIMTNSVAIMSDALHDLGDSLSIGLSWILERIATKQKTKRFTYGFRRFSLLAALINALVLIIGSFMILSIAIPRILNPESTNARGMFLLSILGIAINGYAAYKVAKGKTMNEKVISWHLFEDVLGWVAVLIVSVVMMFTDIAILDPILSVIITLYILWNIVKKLRSTIVLFLQGTPTSLDTVAIENELKKYKGIKNIHDTHIWSLDGENHILSTHIVVNKGSKKDDIIKIKCELKEMLNKLSIKHTTLEIEFEDEDCKLICE